MIRYILFKYDFHTIVSFNMITKTKNSRRNAVKYIGKNRLGNIYITKASNLITSPSVIDCQIPIIHDCEHLNQLTKNGNCSL